MLVIGTREFALEPALAQAEEELARGLERDLLFVAKRVELCEQRGQLTVGRLVAEQIGPSSTMELIIEVLRAEQLELRQQGFVSRHSRKRTSLEPRPGVEQARRDDLRGARSRARRERRLGLRREVEKVGGESPRIEVLRRVRLRP